MVLQCVPAPLSLLVNLIQQSMHIHCFRPNPSNIALCMLQCMAVSPHQRRSSCLSSVHFRLSEKCSCFAAREIAVRCSTCQLDTTKHAYPLLWANPFKYCTLHASMHCSISTPTPQLLPLCCAFPPFRKKSSGFAARVIPIRFSTCQLDTTKHAYPLLWAKPFKYCTRHASMHCSISTPTPQLVPLSCAFPPFRKML